MKIDAEKLKQVREWAESVQCEPGVWPNEEILAEAIIGLVDVLLEMDEA